MMTTYDEFDKKYINTTYINALVDLVNACRRLDVKLDKVQHLFNGWRVTFKGYSGDAICHDGSYDSQFGYWESIGFPWDGDDVSVHDADTLVAFIAALNNVETPWEEDE